MKKQLLMVVMLLSVSISLSAMIRTSRYPINRKDIQETKKTGNGQAFLLYAVKQAVNQELDKEEGCDSKKLKKCLNAKLPPKEKYSWYRLFANENCSPKYLLSTIVLILWPF